MTQFKMVETPQGPDPKRLLLAIVLTSAVLMVYSYFFTQAKEPIAQKEVKEEVNPAPLKEPEVALEAKDSVHEQATPKVPLKISTFLVEEALHAGLFKRTSYRAEISNHGGMIRKYALIDFSDE